MSSSCLFYTATKKTINLEMCRYNFHRPGWWWRVVLNMKLKYCSLVGSSVWYILKDDLLINYGKYVQKV